jgi:hypothetical protein
MKINDFTPNQPLHEGEIYRINGELMRCKKIRTSGINTFQIVDAEGNDLILRDEKNPGMIADFGIRVKRCKQ